MADDAYEVVKGSLKLKGVADGGIKKKKKKKKNKALEEAAKQAMVPETRNSSDEDQEIEKEEQNDNRTAAQKSFDRIQEKRAAERILKKAGKTHRQRVEKFNEYLDELTEHYDIPKVSWTK